MKKLILLLLPAFFLFSCSDDPAANDDNNNNDKPGKKETGWSSDERDQSMDNCIEWKTGDKHQLSKKDAKKICSCLVDAAESVFSYEDWEVLEKDPDNEDISKSKLKKYNKKVDDCNEGSGEEKDPEEEDEENEDEQ